MAVPTSAFPINIISTRFRHACTCFAQYMCLAWPQLTMWLGYLLAMAVSLPTLFLAALAELLAPGYDSRLTYYKVRGVPCT